MVDVEWHCESKGGQAFSSLKCVLVIFNLNFSHLGLPLQGQHIIYLNNLHPILLIYILNINHTLVYFSVGKHIEPGIMTKVEMILSRKCCIQGLISMRF